ncbi:GTP 3',8-cyclase MoaA [Candidatus Bipolaricaulota bacterium]|nr:GTP 3',8-cyclase MoaA [Candidatus Bipolaricaulota bacterium]
MKDSYGREINYLRLSVTDRCNFRCQYCMPEGGIDKIPHDEILSFEEIVRLVRAAANLGVEKVRLTGGEPLARREISGLVEMIGRITGIKDLSMTTNGSRLSELAGKLAGAGLDRVNISLDSVHPDTFSEITRGGDLDEVLAGINAAKKGGLDPVKLNTVIMKGLNESEITDLVEFAVREELVLRFIELMPMGEASDRAIEPLPLEEVRQAVEEDWELKRVSGPKGNGPARYFRVERDGLEGEIGFIFPISKSFCAGCNRLRVTAQGAVRPCLARDEEYGLEIEDDTTVPELEDRLSEIINEKPYGHQWEEERETTGEMSEIGG